MNRVIKGDTKATAVALPMMMRLLDTGEDIPESEDLVLDDELEILKAFEERAKRKSSGEGSPST